MHERRGFDPIQIINQIEGNFKRDVQIIFQQAPQLLEQCKYAKVNEKKERKNKTKETQNKNKQKQK